MRAGGGRWAWVCSIPKNLRGPAPLRHSPGVIHPGRELLRGRVPIGQAKAPTGPLARVHSRSCLKGARLLCVLLALGLSVSVATARPRERAASASEVSLRPPPGLRSRSLDYVWDGRLQRGMRLNASHYVHHVGEYVRHGHFYGTWELVQLIERAARRGAFRLPGAKLSTGELSRQGGGAIGGHRSHRNGRDADIGFYMTGPDGQPRLAHRFIAFDRYGRGRPPYQSLRFDDARNWELIAKLVADADARVQYIFVEGGLRARLLAEGRRQGAPRSLLARAGAVLTVPDEGHPHDNHFHVRIYCSPSDRPRCRDRGPYWPWYPGPLPSPALSLRRGPPGYPSF